MHSVAHSQRKGQFCDIGNSFCTSPAPHSEKASYINQTLRECGHFFQVSKVFPLERDNCTIEITDPAWFLSVNAILTNKLEERNF